MDIDLPCDRRDRQRLVLRLGMAGRHRARPDPGLSRALPPYVRARHMHGAARRRRRQRPDDAGDRTMIAKSDGNRRSPSIAPVVAIIAASLFAASSATGAEPGDPSRGARVFRTCAACHSLQADKNMTGPSLAGLWDRKAGSLASFGRYSPALKSASVVWDQQTLDEWLKDPRRFIPQNRMTFAGIAD